MKKLLLILFLALGYLFKIGPALAQVPPPYVACDDTESPEFHSLRPYQASPCNQNKENLAIFCGNDLMVSDSITKHRDEGTCKILPGGHREECTFTGTKTKQIAIQLSGAYLPIMGNTENVVNSQDQVESFDDAQKTNDYVSWYLNGVTGRAEYPFLQEDSATDSSKVKDFSGPLNRLLPQEIQFLNRIKTIEAIEDGDTRHDQVVGCTYKIALFDFGIPVPCYETGLGSLIPRKEHRISEWKNHLPPIRSDYTDYTEYMVDYKEWRGDECMIIEIPKWVPFLGGMKFMYCYDSKTKKNFYSNLFPYIPYSSTEDRLGEVEIQSSTLNVNGPEIEVSNVQILNSDPADLFFSHMQESKELARLLQSTYVAKDLPQKGSVSNPTVPAGCGLTNIRNNPGDDLFAGEASAEVQYDWKFTCEFELPACNYCLGPLCLPRLRNCDPDKDDCQYGFECLIPGDRDNTPVNPTCTKDVYVNFSVITETPLVDEIWSRLVEGSASVFRKMAPKIDENGPIKCLADIPAVTEVTYTGSGVSPSSGELYFPHIGGISEYFLKGIQTFLRPKGFGEQIISGQDCSSNLSCNDGKIGDIPPLPGGCTINTGGSYGSIPNLSDLPTLVDILETAGAEFSVPPSLILGAMYGEGKFNPGKYDWTEENVQAWSKECASVPNCTVGSWPSTGIIPFQSEYIWEAHKDAVKTVDPDREPSPCNLLDAIFAAAKFLRQASFGSGSFSGKTCFGIALNSGMGQSNNSCSWDNRDIETAIRVWEFGTGYDDTYTCATKEGGCALGGMNAACPGGDLCETISNRYSNPSHNGCVWDATKAY